MARDPMWNRLLFFAALGACEFSTELPADAPGPAITIGFADGASMADEKSSAHVITVRISEVSTRDVTVKYQIEGGTASPPADYDIVTPETMVIPAGQLEVTLQVRVKADTDGTEADETIALVLVEPRGAALAIGTEKHEVTIRARALPRVKFEITQSSAQEPGDATIVAVLDEASEFDITASFAVTSTATSGLDYTLPNGSVTFAAGTKMMPINLDVLDDALDEDNETVTLTLTSSTNSLIDTLQDEYIHTILDDLVDPPPTVQFQAPTSTHLENAGTVNVVVALSAISGRTITVPFLVDAANSNAIGGGTDYTIGTSITIAPGNMTGNVAVTIVDDTIDEPAETVEIDMQAATNATATGQLSHRLQINDNDVVCYGANATVDVCFDTPPTGAVTISGSLDTDGGLCAATQPVNWTDTQDAACVIAGATITVNGATKVFGSRPLVLVAATTLTVSNNLDGSSNEGAVSNGPGTPPNTCAGTA
ncbi:MAG: hypothetical protein H0T65_20875, partial [Deltaproteobacteria bacterium]|nr:hypothetical protein [Deltaproteobacteria bacterium]